MVESAHNQNRVLRASPSGVPNAKYLAFGTPNTKKPLSWGVLNAKSFGRMNSKLLNIHLYGTRAYLVVCLNNSFQFFWKYMWVKECVKIRLILFKNWKHVFKMVYQTGLKLFNICLFYYSLSSLTHDPYQSLSQPLFLFANLAHSLS